MVVTMPPTSTAWFIGISIFEGDPLARIARPITTGIMTTTTGVSLMKALRNMAIARIARSATCRLTAQSRASSRATGSRAPVTMSARPRIIRQQMATSASWPNAEKIWRGPSAPSAPWYGNRCRPSASAAITSRLVSGIGIRSRVKRKKATPVRARTPIACALTARSGIPQRIQAKRTPLARGRLASRSAQSTCCGFLFLGAPRFVHCLDPCSLSDFPSPPADRTTPEDR